MKIAIRDLKFLIKEAILAEGLKFSIKFEIPETDETKIRERLVPMGLYVRPIVKTSNGKSLVIVKGRVDQVKKALQWALRGSGVRVNDYFDEHAIKIRETT